MWRPACITMTAKAAMFFRRQRSARACVHRGGKWALVLALMALWPLGPLYGAGDYTPGLDECVPAPPVQHVGTVVTVSESRPPAVVPVPPIVAVSFASYN